MGTVEGAAVAMVMERGHPSVWSIKFDMRLLCAVYAVSPFNLTVLNIRKKKHVKCNMHCMEDNKNTNEENDVTKWQLFSYICWGWQNPLCPLF